MSVNLVVYLVKTVDDLDQAKDWFEEIRDALQGKTECSMQAKSTNHYEKVEITK